MTPPPRRPVALLMTATIVPAPGMKTRLSDPAARMRDYADALRFNIGWLGRGIDRILVAENSGADLAPLRDIALGHPVELLSLPGEGRPAEWGYGYPEFALVQRAMDGAEGLDDALVAKVTGRYKVRNLDRLIAQADGVDLACDIRNRRAPWLDMRAMFWTSRGFDAYLRDGYHDLRDDVNRLPPEMILSRRILAREDAPRRTGFSVEPDIDGVRGHDGANWGRGALGLKALARRVTRPVLVPLRLHPGAAGDRRSRKGGR